MPIPPKRKKKLGLASTLKRRKGKPLTDEELATYLRELSQAAYKAAQGMNALALHVELRAIEAKQGSNDIPF